MPIIAADLGGTKLATGLFTDDIELIRKEKNIIAGKEGAQVGQLITGNIYEIIRSQELSGEKIKAIGISVPGIYDKEDGTVWAPNIPGWEKFPLFKEVMQIAPNIPIVIHSDRSCYITAEVEKGAARGCKDAVFIAVGTGIGAGIISGGKVIRGAHDIAGAIGWMALDKPYQPKYKACGCFESTASGEGIAKLALEKTKEYPAYSGPLKTIASEKLNTKDVFAAWHNNDPLAQKVIQHCIETWGMALANIVSLLNPEMVIFGGGVFGPAVRWIPEIVEEAKKWGQPISMKLVKVTSASFGSDAGLIGAACLASKSVNKQD